MRFKKISILVALLMIALISSAHAATNLFDIEASDGQDIEINSLGALVGMKRTIEVATTSDTVIANESGKLFLPNISTGTLTFTLPTAALGLEYEVTTINGNGVSGQGTIILNPQSTDTFVGCVNSSATSTFSAGDDLDSPGVTGDSVTIVGNALYWYCSDRIGTWADGN